MFALKIYGARYNDRDAIVGYQCSTVATYFSLGWAKHKAMELDREFRTCDGLDVELVDLSTGKAVRYWGEPELVAAVVAADVPSFEIPF